MAMKPVTIAVRCRKLLPHDRDERVCLRSVGGSRIECFDPEKCREHAYTFDYVFDEDETTSCLFEQLAAPLLPEVLNGKHATLFAYGQTGSGKTHTMLGRQEELGIVQLTLRRLLDTPELSGTSVKMHFVEIYNDKIRDLLHPKCPTLQLRDDPLRGPCIMGVTQVSALNSQRIMEVVRAGNARRTEEMTAANPVSSRSHAVLQFIFEKDLTPNVAHTCRQLFSKLSLVDLAGSERASSTANDARIREGAMINQSLLYLANCITALSRNDAYVNYRDSKLTRLLKDSFSGNCFTTMLAHVGPSIASFEETLSTLKYAHRACQMRGMHGGVRANVIEEHCATGQWAHLYPEKMRSASVPSLSLSPRHQWLLPTPRQSLSTTSLKSLSGSRAVLLAEKHAAVHSNSLEEGSHRQCVEDLAEYMTSTMIEKRLLRDQQTICQLEIDKMEAEQKRVCLEAELRKSELALRRKTLQFDAQGQALLAAQAVLAQHTLTKDWNKAVAPCIELLASTNVAQPNAEFVLCAKADIPDEPETEPLHSRSQSSSRSSLDIWSQSSSGSSLDIWSQSSSRSSLDINLGRLIYEARDCELNQQVALARQEDNESLSAQDNAANPKLRVIALSASGGAVIVGTTAGAAGIVAGGAIGATVGIVPSFFTFGLSIPVGAAIGAGTGMCVGVVAGSAVGAAGGLAAFYTSHTYGDSFRRWYGPRPDFYGNPIGSEQKPGID